MLLVSPPLKIVSPYQSMEQQLMPYQAVSKISAGPALVFAPHPDDEIFGCAGAILSHLAAGEAVSVILVTDGVPGDPDDGERIAQTRYAESCAAARLLGYPDPQCWHLRDRTLEYGEALITRMVEAIRAAAAAVVYAPSLLEMHPDHRVIAMAAIEAVRRVGGALLLAQYEVGVAMRPNRLLDITPYMAQKAAASRVFTSQLLAQCYDEHVAALNRYRTFTLSAAVKAAEGYVVTSADELAADSLAAYASEYRQQRALGLPAIPSDLPLVSVMIRSSDRATLAEALDSVAVQTYPHIEVVVVNVTGRPHSALPATCGRFPLRLIDGTQKLLRAAAANAALRASRGDWLIFLDDDDWMEANHISKLAAATRDAPLPEAVYSGVRCVGPDKQPLPESHDVPFDAQRLWVANYLPIHAVLFSRKLLDAGCHFDEQFTVYEDWDFWLQMSQKTGFRHLPGISAVYRIAAAGGSGVHEVREISSGRRALFDKWSPIAGQRLIDALAAELARLETYARKLATDLHAGQVHDQNLDEVRRTLEQHVAALQESDSAKNEHISSLQAALATLEQHIAALKDELSRTVLDKDGHIQSLQAQLAVEHQALEEQRNESQAQIAIRDGHITNLQADVAKLNAEAIRLGGMIEQHAALLAERERRVNEQLATIHYQNVYALGLEQQRAQQAEQINALEQQRVQLSEQIHRLTQQDAQQTEQIQALLAQRAQLSEQIALLEQQRAEQALDQQATLAAKEALSAQYQELAVAKAALASELDTLQAQKEQLASELYVARGNITQLSGEKARLDQQYLDATVHVRNLDTILLNQQQAYATLVGSRSWKITQPLRWSTAKARTLRTLLALAPRAADRVGGWLPLLQKVLHVWHQQGLSGVKNKAFGLTQGPGELTLPPAESAPPSEYERWIASYDALDEHKRALVAQQIASWPAPPKISILMPVYNAPERWLRRAIDSVIEQLYPHWELCIADDASPDKHIKPLLAEYAQRDARIKIAYRKKNGHISAASNSALELATGDFIALLDHDDELVPHALFAVAREILAQPQADLFYSDEDKIDIHGRRFDPYFKPDWNPDLFLSYNVFSHLGVYRASLIRELGGFREGFDGSQDYDLALRAVAKVGHGKVRHIPHVLYHWRVIPGSTAASHGEKPYALVAAIRAVSEHLSGQGIRATVDESAAGSGALRVRYTLPEKPPLVTIIIPTRDGYELLRQCIDSLYAKTTYPNFEVLVVDNGSTDPRVLDYMEKLKGEGRLSVLRDDSPFNYSALNNKAARVAKGELLCLMNNDIEVISPDWLDEMASHALRKDIGIVGCRLWYPDDTLQHAGVILGMGGVAGHAHHRMTRAQGGYFSRAQLIQNYSAVTAACFVLRKEVYWEVGGLNERDLAVAFNDVELCIRVRDAGYRNLWTPFAELYHHESATRGFEDTPEKQARFSKEVMFMQGRYGESLKFDPAYNPNLALERQDYTLAFPPRVSLLDRK